jgi:hypothetical protein
MYWFPKIEGIEYKPVGLSIPVSNSPVTSNQATSKTKLMIANYVTAKLKAGTVERSFLRVFPFIQIYSGLLTMLLNYDVDTADRL